MGNNSGKMEWTGPAKVVFVEHAKHGLEGSQEKKTKNTHPPLSPPPPSYDHAQAAAPTIYLRPDSESKGVVRPALVPTVVTSSNQRQTHQPAPRQAPKTSKQEPAATPLGGGNARRKDDEEDGISPPIEVLHPTDGGPACVRRPWSPGDVKDLAEGLPDPSSAGGPALAASVAEMVQRHRPSIAEVRQVCINRLGPRWARVRGDLPSPGQADVTFDWDRGSAYRALAEGLCRRVGEAFPLTRDWPAVRGVRQNDGEKVVDLVERLEEVFQTHGGIPVPADRQEQTLYEDSLTLVLLDALDESLSKSVKGDCAGWRTARLAVIVSHARNAETLRDKQQQEQEKRNGEQEAMTSITRLPSQQEAPEKAGASGPRGNASGERKVFRGGARGRGPRGLKKLQGCYSCGAMDHWSRECRQGRETMVSGWLCWPYPPTCAVTRSNPGSGWGPGPWY